MASVDLSLAFNPLVGSWLWAKLDTLSVDPGIDAPLEAEFHTSAGSGGPLRESPGQLLGRMLPPTHPLPSNLFHNNQSEVTDGRPTGALCPPDR